MAAAATARQAAAAARARALATALREFLADAGDGDACGGVRLLLSELAAALHAEPQRQEDEGAAAGPGLPRTRRRRAQRRAAAVRLLSSGAAAGGGLDGRGEPTRQAKSGGVEPKSPQAQELQLGERLAAGATVFVAKDPGADRDAREFARVSQIGAESAGAPQQCQLLLQPEQPEMQAAAWAAAPATAEMAQMEMTANDEQPASAEPRVAAAAEPHKRRAVAAGTAVGAPVGVGGNGGNEGTWTTVLSWLAQGLSFNVNTDILG